MALELIDPPHFGVGRPSSLAASLIPFWVGTKNGFVVTWLTNQNCQAGVAGKFPATAFADDAAAVGAALLELDEVQAAMSAEAAAVALNSPAPSISRRRVGPSFMFRVSIASSTTGSIFSSSKDLHGIFLGRDTLPSQARSVRGESRRLRRERDNAKTLLFRCLFRRLAQRDRTVAIMRPVFSAT